MHFCLCANILLLRIPEELDAAEDLRSLATGLKLSEVPCHATFSAFETVRPSSLHCLSCQQAPVQLISLSQLTSHFFAYLDLQIQFTLATKSSQAWMMYKRLHRPFLTLFNPASRHPHSTTTLEIQFLRSTGAA